MPRKSNSKHGLMECKQLFALLSQYIDAELPPGTCEQMEEHLRGCSPCVSFVNTLRKTAELCRQYQPAEMPRPLKDQAQKELQAAYKAALRRRR